MRSPAAAGQSGGDGGPGRTGLPGPPDGIDACQGVVVTRPGNLAGVVTTMIATTAMSALLSPHQWRVTSGTTVNNDFADP